MNKIVPITSRPDFLQYRDPGRFRGPAEVLSFSVRHAERHDLLPFFKVTKVCWREMEPVTFSMMMARFRRFRAGMFVATDDSNGRIIGCLSSLRMNASEMPRTWLGITGYGAFSTHNPNGDTLFCPQAAVFPKWRGRGVLSGLLHSADELARSLDVPHVVACSRFRSYADYAATRAIPVSDFIKVSTPAPLDKFANIQPEFTHISKMATGIGAYREFARLRSKLANDTSESANGIDSFFRLTGRMPFDPNIALHFHRGATIAEVIPNACPEDRKSGGAMVLMRYR